MGSKTRLSSYCTKRGDYIVNLATSRKLNTRLARTINIFSCFITKIFTVHVVRHQNAHTFLCFIQYTYMYIYDTFICIHNKKKTAIRPKKTCLFPISYRPCTITCYSKKFSGV